MHRRLPARIAMAATLAAASIGACALAAAAMQGSVWSGSSGVERRGAGLAIEDSVSLAQVRTSGRYIRWKSHPDKCVDVWGDHAGAALQLWACNDYHGAAVKREAEFKWILPALNEAGPIVWAGNTSYCVNAPSGQKVQIWYCESAPVKHTRWKITTDGRIHLAYNFGKCLDIPNGEKIIVDGTKLQLFDCMDGNAEKEGNVMFDIYPQNCEWSPWSEWSACSRTSCQRYQARRNQKQAVNGGQVCVGPSTQHEDCSQAECRALARPLPTAATTTAATTAKPKARVLCSTQGKSWAPLDMEGDDGTWGQSKATCQRRCARNLDCRHFSFWARDGGCHLQDAAAVEKDDEDDVWSGPPTCTP